MTIEPGTRLGPYEVITPIGAGGMGEVYQAKDTRLDRTVAIKVLPEHLAESAERKARFEREAKAISQLNHPHICTLYDVGEQDGVDFIVMEYIEGETLAERLKKGALKLDQAVEYGIQIADGLDKAHRTGIVHRDLKPGNVMLTKSGVKLLDFGLARLVEGDDGIDSSDVPTRQKDLTREESIIGTLQYMAPEQLERKPADARTDIFALGLVLYEMITGKKAFEGKTQASLIHAIMGVEPTPISNLQPVSPAALDRIVRICLAKEPGDRWQTARDLTRELRWVAQRSDEQVAHRTAPGTHRIAWSLLGLAVGVLLAHVAGIAFSPGSSGPVTRFRILDEEMRTSFSRSVAVSPAGRTIVYIAERAGMTRLLRRSLEELEPTVLAEGDDIVLPFFSPDGLWVGFFQGSDTRLLRRVSLAGGPAVRICQLDDGFLRGASWGDDDTIVFGVQRSGLMKVSASGGEPAVVIEEGARRHFAPQVMPGGDTVLAAVDDEIVAVSLATGEERTLLEGTTPRYASTGHLVYQSEGSLWAVPFDPRRLEVRGSSTLLVDGVRTTTLNKALFDVSETGTLVYVPARQGAAEPVVWVDRDGEPTVLTDSIGALGGWLRLSPDETRLAIEGVSREGADIWTYDVERGTRTRLTTGGGNIDPLWSPEGDTVAYSTRGPSIYGVRADGGSAPEPIVTVEEAQLRVTSWSPSGDHLAMDALHAGDVWTAPLDGGEPVPFVDTPADEWGARFSPDGRFIAYVSDESGRDEIYVQPFPRTGERWTLSTQGGREPVWSKDGSELFYRNLNALMVVDVRLGPEFEAGPPRVLFEGPYRVSSSGTYYDVTNDGNRFVMIPTVRPGSIPELIVVLNGLEEVARLAPADN